MECIKINSKKVLFQLNHKFKHHTQKHPMFGSNEGNGVRILMEESGGKGRKGEGRGREIPLFDLVEREVK